jgi:hypothetical protein
MPKVEVVLTSKAYSMNDGKATERKPVDIRILREDEEISGQKGAARPWRKPVSIKRGSCSGRSREMGITA